MIATSGRWTAPNGRTTDLSYQVLTDRARPDVGLVRLEMTPRWSGTATITDAIDGSPATLSTQLEKGWSLSNRRDWVSVQTVGTKITAAIVSQLSTSANVKGQVDSLSTKASIRASANNSGSQSSPAAATPLPSMSAS